MSHQTIVIREEAGTLRIDQVTVPSRISSKITLPVGGDPLTFCDENGNLLLTIDEDGNIISEKGFFELSGQAAPALSPAGKMRLYFDSGTNKLLISENGGAYADLLAGAGNVVGPASATDDALVRWDTATGKLLQNSNALLNDGGDLTLVGSQSLGKFLDVTGIAAPAVSGGGKSRLYFDSTSNKLRLSENGGAFVDVIGAAGDVVGPGSATDEALVRFDSTTGKLIQNSLVTVTDTGDLSTPGQVTLVAADAGDGGLVDSPTRNLRANFDADPTGGVTPTARDFEFKHVMLTGGASPTSKLSFLFAGFEEANMQRTSTSMVLSRTGFSNAFLQLDNNAATLAYSGANFSIASSGALTAKSAGINRAHYNVSSTGRTIWISSIADSDTAVGYQHNTSVLDKDTFTAGALHSIWTDAGADKIMTLSPGGDLFVLGDIEIDGDIDHDGSNVGFYGTAPVAQSAAYTRDATVVEDRTLLASASATTINNNNVLAALIADIQATGLLG